MASFGTYCFACNIFRAPECRASAKTAFVMVLNEALRIRRRCSSKSILDGGQIGRVTIPASLFGIAKGRGLLASKNYSRSLCIRQCASSMFNSMLYADSNAT